MKKKVFGVILIGTMLLGITGCGQQQEDEVQVVLLQEEEEAAYPTTTVEYGDVVKKITIDCSYTSTEKQELAFPVDDRLIEYIGVKVGDYVTEGQLLASLDVADLEEEIQELKYQISCQELELTQTQEMRDQEISNAQTWYEGYTNKKQADKDYLKEQLESIDQHYKTKLEDMADSLNLSRKRLKQYQQEYDDGRLLAGMTGQVSYMDKDLVKGAYCVKDRMVITVSNLDACYFMTNKLEYKDYLLAEPTIEIVYKSGEKEYTCEAEPVFAEDWTEQMYFKPLGMELIESGTAGTITMELGRKQNVLCLPKSAVHESDKGPFVYLENDGLLETRYVTTGLEGDDVTEITAGLEQGEMIALTK